MIIHFLDEDEYEKHRKEMNYPEAIDRILHGNHVGGVKRLIRQRKGLVCSRFILTFGMSVF